MLALTRVVRFAINPPRIVGTDGGQSGRDPNGFAGSPSMRGLGRHFEVQVRCSGEIDSTSTYLIDIKEVDRAVRLAIIPALQEACDTRPETEPAKLMPDLVRRLAAALGPRLQSLRLWPSPYHSIEMAAANTTTPTPTTPVVLLRQKFDFSASHRLHIPTLSDEENQRLFGKCNNPSGHGHNYQFEPCVAVPLSGGGSGESGRHAMSLWELERLADEVIIQKFDHKYLNTDTKEFRTAGPGQTGGGVNPSVENIARVFFDLLAPAVRERTPGCELRSITVWETDRTSCTFPA